MDNLKKVHNIYDLENKKISSLLWEYAIPGIIGTVAVALYSIIDSIYIGNNKYLGDHANGGLGILLPIMNFLSGIGMLIGAGAAARTSIFLGKKDNISAEKIVGNSIILSIVLTLFPVIYIYIYIDKILFLLGTTSETLPFAKEFLKYYLPGNIFLILNFSLNNIMRSSGYPKKAMYTMLIGVGANIILAPIFIFILNLGMKGAAIATNLSIFLGLCFVLTHFFQHKNTLTLKWKRLKPDFRIIWAIISIGFAPFFILIAASLIVFIINHRLVSYGGSIAIEAYTLANRILMVFIMIIVGLTQGMQPIIGYNYGAKRLDRVKQTLKYTLKVGFIIGLIGCISGVIFPHIIIKMFNPSPYLAKHAERALHILTLTLPLSGIQMVISSYFQCIGKAIKAFFLSMTRQFLILIPALYILPKYFELNGIWYSVTISDTISTLIAIIMFILQIKTFKYIK
ncbi:MATE family efflux transporter [Apibacter muscae]|uniref:Multidrug export protein MepA n=1 Tax=Apibacter muscae TaxID=2509004 RepID=A0A563DHY0_9FLAO|nr:MATE family efflux transporter [Apibacter muscae]TWP29805.1 MATE family efflux transporter [Apibacter muscae]TWP30953.1 MATE family efflux transporter [Apibacter muscae]